jgi:hypothetical protein
MVSRVKTVNFFIILFLMFGFNLIFSYGANFGVCCYSKSSGDIYFASFCQNDDINLGGENVFVEGSSQPCTYYTENRKAVESDGICYGSIENKKIYDHPSILSYLGLDSQNIVDYSNSCSSSSNSNEVLEEGGSQENGGGENNVDSNGIDFQNTRDPDEETLFCKDFGGIGGMFIDKNSCLSSDYCSYIPYLGGIFSTSFAKDEVFNFDKVEYGCISKLQYSSCFDYKTKDLCLEDVNGFGNCEWIGSDKYSEFNVFNLKKGFCVEKSNAQYSRDVYFKDEYLPDRKNLISNPYFYSNFEGWQTTGSLSSDSYYGSNSVLLKPGENISQDIVNVFDNYVYQISFKGKVNDTLGKIKIKVIAYKDSNYINTYEEIKDLSFEVFGSYVEYRTNQFSFEDFNKVSVVFENVGETKINLDLISFEAISKGGFLISDRISKPFQIISEKASRCEICHEEEGLNFCQQKKSRLLGDCSYMPEEEGKGYNFNDIVNYLGNPENIYKNNNSFMSLANSKIFCEIYSHNNKTTNPESACESSENFINKNFKKFHPFSENTLCKWDDQYGCFKDSNGDNFPDTRVNLFNVVVPKLRYLDQDQREAFESFSEYNKISSEETLKISDFKLGCDYFPPIAHIELIGKKRGESDYKVINDNDLYGDIQIKYNIQDPFMDSCLPFKNDFDLFETNKLFIDLKIGDKKYYKELDINQIFKKENFVDFLNSFVGFNVEDLEDLNFNDVSILVYDYSGNVGDEFSFNLNLDLDPPIINISSILGIDYPNDHVIGFLSTNNKKLNVNVFDFGGIDSCSYTLTPQNTALDSSYYNSSGKLNLEGDDFNQNLVFDLPLFNSSKNGDFYKLTIICLDVFGMGSSKSVFFIYDQNIDFYLVEPQSFIDPGSNVGYLNQNTFSIHLVSEEKNLQECKALVNNNDIIPLNVNEVDSGFNILDNNYVPSDLIFYSNITGTINNLMTGENNVSVECKDNNGNIFEQEYKYMYDGDAPFLKNYTLKSYSNGNIYYDGLNYYSIDDSNLYFDIYLDPTNGLIDKDSFNFSLESEDLNSELLDFDIEAKFRNFRIAELGKYNAIEFSDFSLSKQSLSFFTPREKNLFEMNFNISFKDVSGNNGSSYVKYFYDSSVPKLNFSGDVFLVDNLDSVYTDVSNPNFIISFNAPKYRKFTCNVTLEKEDGIKFFKSFDSAYKISFKLKDISSNVEMKEGNAYDLEIKCVDVYGISLKKHFKLKFDNTNPILKNVYFNKGNKKFLRNFENIIYGDLKDDIIFDFKDTSEEYYNCKYKITDNTNVYDCNKEEHSVSFNGNINTIINNLNILRGTNSLDENALCERNDKFYEMQSLSFEKSSKKLLTNVKFEFQCFDSVNNPTEKKEINYEINYIQNDLTDFEINYTEGKIFSKVFSFTSFDKIIISSDAYGQEVLDILENPVQNSNGLYEFKSVNGIENSKVAGFDSIFAVVLDNNGEVVDRISINIINDGTKPVLTVDIPDMLDKKIYSDTFEVDMKLEDYESGPKTIRAYLNDVLVYDYLNLDSDKKFEGYKIIIDNSEQYVSENLLNAKFVFKNLSFGKYKFEVLGEDKASNFINEIIEFEVVDGIGLILKDSSNSKVDLNNIRWITKEKSPTISFKTTKVVDNCIVYPFIDPIWNYESEDDLSKISKSLGGGTDFSFDLSSFVLFDLTKNDKIETKIKISCYYNSTYYDYERSILYVNFLPDYVLSIKKGFSINQEPFESLATIKSVGPYRPIKCSYSYNNGVFKEIEGGDYSDVINFNLDFSSLETGENYINIKCEDLAGNIGPEKRYKLYVDKYSTFKISDLKLYSKNSEYLLKDNVFYLNSDQAKLSFKTNFKDGVSCSYRVDSKEGIFSGVINFFRELFDVEQKEIVPKDSFEFVEDNIKFKEGENKLIINCVYNEGNYIEEYDVKVNKEVGDFNLI